MIYIEDDFTKELDKLLFNFFWSNRKHGISKNTVIQIIDSGGLKRICITSMIKSVKIMWFKRLLNNINAKWKILSWHFLGIDKAMLFSRLNLNLVQIPSVRQRIMAQSYTSVFTFLNFELNF